MRRAALVLVVPSVLLALSAAWVAYHLRDRHPGYAVNLLWRPDAADAGPGDRVGLRAGFARQRITPDLNRPVWLAGFATGRRATAVHDDLWATAMVLDDGERTLGVVALDSIGIFHDDVVAIRQRVAAAVALDYVIVTATHNHSTPDLMGLWGPRLGFSGVDAGYRALIVDRSARALTEAAAGRVPARLSLLEIPIEPDGLLADTRHPQVFDSTLRMMWLTSAADDTTLGSVVNWADHPETPWSANTEITADFPGYLRDLLERGVAVPGQPRVEGLGGTHLYINGAIGGLMTTPPDTAVTDPFTGRSYQAPSHDKARAVAHRLGREVLSAIARGTFERDPAPRIGLAARTLTLPVHNPLFRAALALGTVDRGQPQLNTVRTEVALATIGQASIAAVPGELYPEIANGGIVRPAGGDFDVEPQEVPPLRVLMPGRVRFLFGLANDAIGYVIPKSQWDVEPPWLNGATERPYGEEVSLGPETAPLLHRAFRELAAALAP